MQQIQFQTVNDVTWQSDHGLGTKRKLEFGRPTTGGGWKYCGHFYRNCPKVWIIHDGGSGLLQPPVDWVQVWNDTGSKKSTDYTIWIPEPPPGYVALGCYCSFHTDGKAGRPKPCDPDFVCVHESIVLPGCMYSQFDLWSDAGSRAQHDITLSGKPDGLLWPSASNMHPAGPPACITNTLAGAPYD